MNELVKLYNPANAAALTPEQIEALQKLDSPQIKELAEAYPNSSIHHAYLLIIDSRSKLPVERQLPQLSTFENLWNLREKNAQRQWVAFGFRGTYKATPAKTLRPRHSQVLDLSEVELMSLPGFKKNESSKTFKERVAEQKLKDEAETETVKVTKIKKVPIEETKPKAPRKTKSK